MEKTKIEALDALYKSVSLASEFDFEVTLDGNGCSSFEVFRCMEAVYDILDIPRPKTTKKMKIEYLENLGEDPSDYL